MVKAFFCSHKEPPALFQPAFSMLRSGTHCTPGRGALTAPIQALLCAISSQGFIQHDRSHCVSAGLALLPPVTIQFPMSAAQQPPLTTNLGEIRPPHFQLEKISCTVSRSLPGLGPHVNWWNCCSQPQTRSPLLSPPHSQVIALRWSHQGGEGVKRELEKKLRERLIEAVEGNCKLVKAARQGDFPCPVQLLHLTLPIPEDPVGHSSSWGLLPFSFTPRAPQHNLLSLSPHRFSETPPIPNLYLLQ